MTVAHSCRTAMKLPELLAAGRSGGTVSLLQFPAILLSHLRKTPRIKPRRSARLVAPSTCESRGIVACIRKWVLVSCHRLGDMK